MAMIWEMVANAGVRKIGRDEMFTQTEIQRREDI